MRVLLVEDDHLLGDGVMAGLRHAGYTVDWLTDGVAAWQALETEQFDLLVLDLSLPRLDGLSLLRQLRSSGYDLPVLLLTARDTVSDRVTGLDAGADDYLTKPFDLDELTARLRALQRRANGRSTPQLEAGDLMLDPAAHRVTLAGEVLELPAREFALLQLLLEQVGHVITRSRLEQTLYGWQTEIESNALEVHIHRLRRKLGSDRIETVRGVGYRMVAR